MQVLEPTLIKSPFDTATSGAAEIEVDFDFAALEGALILQSQFYVLTDVVVADIEIDNFLCAAFNYNPTITFGSIDDILGDDFTFSAWTHAFAAAGTPANVVDATLTSPLYTHEGLLIVRNPSFHSYAGAGSPTFYGKIWYKRVIFDERELVPFVALRR